ncbi:right-handed parallel beta-helix repeat-containing protein [Kitasatospora sp. NPDC088346]|uniref:right-handed parallel beta-helix repeat-containing protein n=1 Tax=Kitasatospora sp. NPDC088346 TaxID=3364073 RepID=UPI0037FAB7A4
MVRGAEHVRFQDLAVNGPAPSESVLVDGGHDIAFRSVNPWSGNVRITGASRDVSYTRAQFGYVRGPVLRVDGNSTGTVLSTNVITGNSGYDTSGILVSDAPGTVVVSNTVTMGCVKGLVLEGASTGAVVENSVISTVREWGPPCAAGAPDAGITVAASSVQGTKVDYNVVSPLSGGPAYDWSGATYRDRAAFTEATGQGAHDAFADPSSASKDPAKPLSPVIDSADENAPGMLDVDAWGWHAVDDPVVPNTGTGRGIRDRGAAEFQDFGSVFTAVDPQRILDTRDGTGAPQATVPAQGTLDLQIAGTHGIPADATAVTLNVTVTDTTQDGHLTAYPHGDELPRTSNLNWTTGKTVANLVTLPLKDGKVSFHNASAGTIDLVADLAGHYGSTGRDTFRPLGPWRLVDTREDSYSEGSLVRPAGVVPAGGRLDVSLGEMPNPTSVTLNVTVTEPGSAGHLTAYPAGGAVPGTSNLNWSAGETVANQVVVKVKDGKVSLLNAGTAPVHLVVDLLGYQAP